MCFVAVEGQAGTYRHVASEFVHTVMVDKSKLAELAALLGIPEAAAANWKPGKIVVANTGETVPKKSRSK